MSVPHSPGKLRVSKQRASVTLVASDGTEVTFVPDEQHHTLTDGSLQNVNATRLALCWNMHDELVNALRSLVKHCISIHTVEGVNAAGLMRDIASAQTVLAKLNGGAK